VHNWDRVVACGASAISRPIPPAKPTRLLAPATHKTQGRKKAKSTQRQPARAKSAGATGQKQQPLPGPRQGTNVGAQSPKQLPRPRKQQKPNGRDTITSWQPAPTMNAPRQHAFGGALIPPSLPPQRAPPTKKLPAKKLTAPMQESKFGAQPPKQLPRPRKQQQPNGRHATATWQSAPAMNVLHQHAFDGALLGMPPSSLQQPPPAKNLAAKVSGAHTKFSTHLYSFRAYAADRIGCFSGHAPSRHLPRSKRRQALRLARGPSAAPARRRRPQSSPYACRPRPRPRSLARPTRLTCDSS
jgi:hypothetical protein